MSKCVNKNCHKDAHNSTDCQIVSCDGDAACSKECKKEYYKQMDAFYAPGGPASSSANFEKWFHS